MSALRGCHRQQTAGCLNYLVFKGNHVHDVRVPGVIAALPGVPLRQSVQGPSILALGDFVGPGVSRGSKLDKRGGLLHRFGMDDASTGAMLRDLMARGGLPDFTIAHWCNGERPRCTRNFREERAWPTQRKTRMPTISTT